MEVEKMRGYIIFKENKDESITMFRIMRVNNNKVIVRNMDTEEEKILEKDELKNYTILEPDGYITFNIVKISNTFRDVVVTASRIRDLKNGDTFPFAVCRQNIIDVFYNLLVKDESEMMVGLSISRNTCPANYSMTLMLACNEIEFSESINIYRTDTLDDIYKFISARYNDILEELYKTHVNRIGDPVLLFKNHHDGWCKNLRTLLQENNFQYDIDDMLGISSVDFVVEDYSVLRTWKDIDVQYISLTDDLIRWFSSLFKVNITELVLIKYGFDIDVENDFNNEQFFLIRDKNKILYICCYKREGEYHEAELAEQANKKDFSTEFRLNFYNKYNDNK